MVSQPFTDKTVCKTYDVDINKRLFQISLKLKRDN